MIRRGVSLFVVMLAIASVAAAQRPTDIVKWSAQPPSKPVQVGGVAKVALAADIEPGWKLYAMTQPKGGPVPLSITVAKGAPFTLVTKEIVSPAAKAQKDELFSGGNTQYYESDAAFVLPVTVPKSTAPGDHTVPVDVTFQACGKEICLRPFTQRLEVTLTIVK